MMLPKQRSLATAALLAFSTVLPPALARAQAPATPAASAPSTFFPFVIPWDDATTGVATDMSWLNAKPAGVNGRIVARDGHFVEEKTGKRIRFLGTNFTFAENYPTHADAEKVAAHVAKLGINIVRIHHHDADYGLLWDKKFPDHQHFSAESIDRLDYLIAQFKRNGVYVDLNLHVSREFTPEDGFPASVSEIKTGYDKRVDNYDRKMIALQKKFAHDYLTHVNPYTKISYTDDPCVAMIEINNENTLVERAGTSLAAGLDDLPEPFRGELVALWNDWLIKRYKNDGGLRTAWTFGGNSGTGASLVTADSKWTFEPHDLGGTLTPSPATDSATAPSVEIAAPKIDDQAWHIQAHLTGLNLKSGSGYTVSFEAKADQPRSMNVYTGMDEDDWHHVGLDAPVAVGTDWKTYTLPFEADRTVENHSRLTFVLGNRVGAISIRNVALTPGIAPSIATGGGTLAARTIDMPTFASKQERVDWVHFLADTERAYADEMLDYVKHDLKARANVIDSQVGFGESASLYREAKSDFADGHAYWEHPSFPGKPWDSVDWNIRNTPMVAQLSTTGGTLLQLAQYRVAGKPFTVTEYNEPAPSDYQSETLPELASFAALQDWDAIFLFDWAAYGEAAGEQNNKIQGFFAVGSNPAKAAFLPAAALIFRGEQIGTLAHQSTLNLPTDEAVTGVTMSTFWKGDKPETVPTVTLPDYGTVSGKSREEIMTSYHHLLKVSQTDQASAMLDTRMSVELTSSKSTRFDDRQREELLPSSVDFFGKAAVEFTGGPAACAAGFLGGKSILLQSVLISIPNFGNNFCAVSMTSAPKGSGALLTIVGKVENTGMVWNAERTSVGNQWGTGPSQAEYVPAAVTLLLDIGSHVWALDGTGKRTKEIPVERTGKLLTFKTDPEAHTVWYEITAVK